MAQRKKTQTTCKKTHQDWRKETQRKNKVVLPNWKWGEFIYNMFSQIQLRTSKRWCTNGFTGYMQRCQQQKPGSKILGLFDRRQKVHFFLVQMKNIRLKIENNLRKWKRTFNFFMWKKKNLLKMEENQTKLQKGQTRCRTSSVKRELEQMQFSNPAFKRSVFVLCLHSC